MQATNENKGVLVNVKRVRKGSEGGKDHAGREQLVLTFGTDKTGQDGLEQLISALEQYRGKQVNFDIRVGEKQANNGSTFETAFVIVKEMIPKGATAGAPAGKSQFTPKAATPGRAAQVKAKAAAIREDFQG